ncbi:TetR/AcrR family transcriptional regulator [Nonomuraea longicatena]|uniref:TetR/AcrR family transcriptional regulator n=1 Tax=Nonomuraea longicatena TaxID=83682 RepID=UPI0031E2FFCE
MTENTTRLRADARRKREQIVIAAREVFLEQGIHAPPEEIARRAGIGIATLYRRFPGRHTLVQQVALDSLTRSVRNWTAPPSRTPTPWARLRSSYAAWWRPSCRCCSPVWRRTRAARGEP